MSVVDETDGMLSSDDMRKARAVGFGEHVGLGDRIAVLVIDVQEYMVHVPGGPGTSFPSSCGKEAQVALPRIARVLSAARAGGVPVVYTKFELRADGSDIGVYGRKRRFLTIDGWCLEGSLGAQVAEQVKPEAHDWVLVKKKPSAFMGTPLLGLLIDWGINTVIVTGGSTSNCVRATVVDSASYNFRTTVLRDCVFDRFPVSHTVALFDMDRQYADVVDSSTVLSALAAEGG